MYNQGITLITLINALVFSKLFTLHLSRVTQLRLILLNNKIQACRIVSGVKKYDHVTPILKELLK